METKAHKKQRIIDEAEDKKKLEERQLLAEQFRRIAEDHGAVTKLAEDTSKAMSNDLDVVYLCQRFRTARGAHAVRALADLMKAGKDCCDLTLDEQKALAEKFRAIADDRVAVAKLADETCECRLTPDPECMELCARFKAAPNADVVRAIADEVKAKTPPVKEP